MSVHCWILAEKKPVNYDSNVGCLTDPTSLDIRDTLPLGVSAWELRADLYQEKVPTVIRY